jgi:ADP-ribosylglycohydrolase
MGKERILQNILDGRRKHLSKIQGCLIGGAAGDALGYIVEFMHYRDIRQTFGPQGIMEYELVNGKAQISDDTQMSLFTANGLLYGETCMMLRNIGEPPHTYVPYAYRDWLYTQDKNYKPEKFISWLVNIPELNTYRAPGRTCLSALRSGKFGTMENPINHSCGCGGVMRVAPLGLFYGQYYDGLSDENLIRYGAGTAAVTHGHPWGYIPAGFLALIIKKAAFSDENLLKIITDSMEETKSVFGENEYWKGFENLMQMTFELVGNDDEDDLNIQKIGEGWVGHETLAVAVYCALRYEHEFSRAVVAAANHDGDSDSTAAVCGNILGAYLGLDGIDDRWKENLELRDTILEIGMDLCDHCHMDENGDYEEPDWLRKYVNVN